MFQSTLLRRTMSLVIISLIASAILATIAFIVAGRTATIESETKTAINQDIVYRQMFLQEPELLERPLNEKLSDELWARVTAKK